MHNAPEIILSPEGVDGWARVFFEITLFSLKKTLKNINNKIETHFSMTSIGIFVGPKWFEFNF